jgi:hypothetical protein
MTMNPIRRLNLAGAGILALAISLVTSGAAVATEPKDGPTGLFVKSGGKLIELDESYFEERHIEAKPPAEGNGPSSRLIEWNQWFGCFSLNSENDVFANYMEYWNGTGRDVRLKCGNDNWGYKHIRNGKEASWQAKLDAAKAAGWNPQSVGVESWDDLMSGATGAVILWPEYRRVESINKKVCGNSEFYLLDLKTGRELYSFNVEAAWASDSDRLITAYPSSRTTC